MPPELSDLVMQLLAKKPEDRPGTAQEVAAELAALAEENADRGAESGEVQAASTIRRHDQASVRRQRGGAGRVWPWRLHSCCWWAWSASVCCSR